MRQDGAEKQHIAGVIHALNQQGGEIFDIEIAQGIGMVFHVHPDEAAFRMPRRQLGKRRAVAAAGAAPLGAQARDQQLPRPHARMQRSGISVGREKRHKQRQCATNRSQLL